MTIRVILADNHPSTCAGLRAMLDAAPDIAVVGEAHDGIEAQQMVADLRPDVLLLDLVMPGPRPWEVEEWVRTHYPQTSTLVLTAHDRDCLLAQMKEAGAAGFLIKGEQAEHLVEALRRAARGEILFTPHQQARASRWQEEVGKRLESLTGREREVLHLLAAGKTNKEIAQALRIKVKTVGNHVSSVLEKLGVDSRTQAALWAVREGFVHQDARCREKSLCLSRENSS